MQHDKKKGGEGRGINPEEQPHTSAKAKANL